MTKVFIKRSWGFHPETWPIISFGEMSARDALIQMSGPGDLIVCVGTKGEPTAEEDQGIILGIAEFSGRRVNNSLALIKGINPDIEKDKNAFSADGTFRWPYGVPIVRAWRFTDRPVLTDVMKQLPQSARVRAVLLSPEDQEKVLALKKQEITVHPAISAFRDMSDALGKSGPTNGLAPASWSKTVSRDIEGAAFTYACQFGDRDIWKIGWAKDIDARLKDINTHIPHEVINEKWAMIFKQPWPTETLAYKMEQTILGLLSDKRTVGERVCCSRNELDAALKSAWLKIL